VKEIPKPPRRSSGLLSKVRREGKPKQAPSEPSQPPLERIFRPVLEAAPAVPPTASAPPPLAPKAEKPQAELPSVRQPVPTPPPERASGLLGKMRRSSRQARPSAEAQPTVEKPPTVQPDEAERHVHTPIPAQPEPREKDLSALLDAVREAAETGRLREQTPTEPIAAEEPPECPKPTAEKRPSGYHDLRNRTKTSRDVPSLVRRKSFQASSCEHQHPARTSGLGPSGRDGQAFLTAGAAHRGGTCPQARETAPNQRPGMGAPVNEAARRGNSPEVRFSSKRGGDFVGGLGPLRRRPASCGETTAATPCSPRPRESEPH
jgi:hypothetical protein